MGSLMPQRPQAKKPDRIGEIADDHARECGLELVGARVSLRTEDIIAKHIRKAIEADRKARAGS